MKGPDYDLLRKRTAPTRRNVLYAFFDNHIRKERADRRCCCNSPSKKAWDRIRVIGKERRRIIMDYRLYAPARTAAAAAATIPVYSGADAANTGGSGSLGKGRTSCPAPSGVVRERQRDREREKGMKWVDEEVDTGEWWWWCVYIPTGDSLDSSTCLPSRPFVRFFFACSAANNNKKKEGIFFGGVSCCRPSGSRRTSLEFNQSGKMTTQQSSMRLYLYKLKLFYVA